MKREAGVGQSLRSPVSQLVTRVAGQAAQIGAGGTDPQGERHPPAIEAGEVDGNSERRVLDLARASRLKELNEVAFTSTGKVGLVRRLLRRSSLVKRTPELPSGSAADLDAALALRGRQHRSHRGRVQSGEEPFDEGLVDPADELRSPYRERVEGAVAQPDAV